MHRILLRWILCYAELGYFTLVRRQVRNIHLGNAAQRGRDGGARFRRP